MKTVQLLFLCAVLMLGTAATAETMALPDYLTRIGEEAFAGDISLDRVIVPEGVEEIGSRAFAGSSLRALELPESLMSISSDALEGCGDVDISAPAGSYAEQWAKQWAQEEYDKRTTPASEFDYEDLEDGTCSITGYRGAGGEVVIPGTIDDQKVVKIGSYAFARCESLTGVRIPDGVTTIGEGAFMDCGNLASISIPNSVRTIGAEVFSHCGSLKEVTIPDGVEAISDFLFINCASLKSVRIPDSVTEIWYYAFTGCNSLKSLTLPDSVTYLGAYTFEDCEALESVTLSKRLAKIGHYAFHNCTSLKEVTIPPSVTALQECTFAGCTSLTSVTLPNSISDIWDNVFKGCVNLTSATIPNRVVFFGKDIFSGCKDLIISGVPGSRAEDYASANGISFKAIAAQPRAINAEIEQSLFFLGVGQTIRPSVKFSDGETHTVLAPQCNVISGTAVKSSGPSIEGVEPGMCTVEYNMAGLDDLDCVLNTENSPRFKAQVAYRLPYERLRMKKPDETFRLGRGEVVVIDPEIYGGDYNVNTLKSDIQWYSGNEDAVIMGYGSGIGSLYAISKGTATVTMLGSLGAKCELKVEVCDPPTSMQFTENYIELGAPDGKYPGEQRQLSIRFPDGQYWFNVEYYSNNEDVVTVSESGVVQARKAGEAIITAVAGEVRTAMGVTVVNAPTGIHFERDGVEISEDTVIKNLSVAMPPLVLEDDKVGGTVLVLEGENVSRNTSIVYKRNNTVISGGSFPTDKNCTIYATTYNGKTAKLTVKVEENDNLNKLRKWYKALNDSSTGAKAKLAKQVKALNGRKGTREMRREIKAKGFDGAKRDWAADARLTGGVDGINVTPFLVDGLDRAVRVIFYDEFSKSGDIIETLSECKDQAKLVKEINALVIGDKRTKTVTLEAMTGQITTYTFTFSSIGTDSLGAQLMMGKVTVKQDDGAGQTYDFGATITDFSQIRKFLDELGKLAKAEEESAVSQAITGGIEDMGVNEALDYMKTLNEAKVPLKSLLIAALNSFSEEKLGDVMAALIMNNDSWYKKVVNLDDKWEEMRKALKFAAKNDQVLIDAVLAGLGSAKLFSLDDMEELKQILNMKDVGIFNPLKSIITGKGDLDPEEVGKKIDEAWAAL